MQGNKPSLQLHVKPKQSIALKGGLIMATAASISVLVLTAIIWSLGSTQPIKNTTNQQKIKTGTNKDFVVSKELSDLPKSYADVDAIKKYSVAKEQTTDPRINVIMQQLDDLRNSYDLLKLQLEAYKNKDKEEAKVSSPGDQMAKTSGLFFSGVGSSDLTTKLPTRSPYSSLDDTTEAEKLRYRDRPDYIYNQHKVIKPMSRYQIMAGTTIPATLVTGIDSSVQGTVVAHITQNIYDTATGKYLLIPRGSKAIGDYNLHVVPGQTRVSLSFNRIIRPDTTSIELDRFMASDLQGQAGLKGKVDNHTGTIVGSAILAALINYGGSALSDSKSSANKNYAGAQQTAITSATSGMASVPQQITSRALGMPPVISLPAGYMFNITVNKDLLLNKYNPEF